MYCGVSPGMEDETLPIFIMPITPSAGSLSDGIERRKVETPPDE